MCRQTVGQRVQDCAQYAIGLLFVVSTELLHELVQPNIGQFTASSKTASPVALMVTRLEQMEPENSDYRHRNIH